MITLRWIYFGDKGILGETPVDPLLCLIRELRSVYIVYIFSSSVSICGWLLELVSSCTLDILLSWFLSFIDLSMFCKFRIPSFRADSCGTGSFCASVGLSDPGASFFFWADFSVLVSYCFCLPEGAFGSPLPYTCETSSGLPFSLTCSFSATYASLCFCSIFSDRSCISLSSYW